MGKGRRVGRRPFLFGWGVEWRNSSRSCESCAGASFRGLAVHRNSAFAPPRVVFSVPTGTEENGSKSTNP